MLVPMTIGPELAPDEPADEALLAQPAASSAKAVAAAAARRVDVLMSLLLEPERR
jgi:hypothetical protein